MVTRIHLPKPLLEAVDRRARELGLSRDALIVRAVEREVARGVIWPPGFFEQLESGTEAEAKADAKAVDEMLAAIRSRRTRKMSPRL